MGGRRGSEGVGEEYQVSVFDAAHVEDIGMNSTGQCDGHIDEIAHQAPEMDCPCQFPQVTILGSGLG